MNPASDTKKRADFNRPMFKVSRYAKDGTLKGETIISERKFVTVLAGLYVAWFGLSLGSDELSRYAKKTQADEMRPRMEALANQGQPEAGLWLAKNFAATEHTRFSELAEKGVPEAMYIHGRMLLKDGNKAGTDWVIKAADAGHFNAVDYLQHLAEK